MLLYIMLAYLMLFTALLGLFVCIMLIVLPLTLANAFCFHALSWIIDTVYLFKMLFCIMHSAINLLALLILCSHHFFNERAMCSLEK